MLDLVQFLFIIGALAAILLIIAVLLFLVECFVDDDPRN